MAYRSKYDKVQMMYVAYYGRPADSGGIDYWLGQLSAASGDMEQVVDAFGNSVEEEQSLGLLSSSDLIDLIYQNSFSRLPDTAGKAYWVGEIDAGRVSRPKAAWYIVNGASGIDVDTINNKITVANTFTDYVDLGQITYDQAVVADAKTILGTVTNDAATVASGIDGTHSYVNSVTTLSLPADTSGAVVLTIDSVTSGSLDVASEEDLFSVTLTQHQPYTFTLTSAVLDKPGVRLFDAYGNVLAFDDVTGAETEASFYFTPSSAGQFYVEVFDNGGVTNLGGYDLLVSSGMPDDLAGSTSTTGVLSLDQESAGRLEVATDSDWWRFTGTQWQKFDFEVVSHELSDPLIKVYSTTGTLLNNPASSTIKGFSDLTGGNYYLEVVNASGATVPVGDYILVSTLNSDDDFAQDISTSGAVILGGSSSGEIERQGDSDWFKVSLSQWETYDFSVSSSNIDNVIVNLYDSTGALKQAGGGASIIGYLVDTNGSYYLEVVAGASASVPVGSYTLTANSAIVSDDYSATTSTTGSLVVGTQNSGRLESVGDADWFAVTLTQWATYDVSVTSAQLDKPIVKLYNSAGTLVLDNVTASINSHTAQTGGTFYVQVSDNAGTTPVGNYSLIVNNSAVSDDFDGSTSTTGTIALGVSSSGNLEVTSDKDWFAVTLTQWETYDFSVTSSVLDKPVLKLYDNSGMLRQDNLDGNLQGFLADISGTYYLEVSSDATAAVPLGTYSVSGAAVVVSDDYTADISTAGLVAEGMPSSGRLESSGDRDWFALALAQWDTVDILVSSAQLDNPVIKLYDSTGTLLLDNTTSAINAYVANTAGTFYVEVQSGSGVVPVGDYTLTVGGTADDYSADVSTTGVLVMDSSVSGRLEGVTDADWFAIDLVQWDTVDLNLTSTEIDSLIVKLYDGTGALLVDNTTASLSGYLAESGGTHYVEVTSGGGASPIGVYDLSAGLGVVADDYTGDASTSGTLAVAGTSSGRLETRDDTDWFAISLKEWYTYKFEVTSLELDAPVVRVYDSSGALVYDNTSAIIEDFVASAAGTYFIEVKDGGGMVPVGNYSLSAEENMADDFINSLSTTARFNVGGSIDGRINYPLEKDLIGIDLSQGTSYHFSLTSTFMDSPKFYLLNPEGQILATDYQTSTETEASIDYTASLTGTFFVQITTVGSIPVGDYTMSAIIV